MESLITIRKLIRIKQWYKNGIVFLPLFFSLNLFSVDAIIISILGFLGLCLVSGAGYIRNDIQDINKDKLDPIKCKRPLPSGKITIKEANILFVVCFSVGLSLSFLLDWKFGLITMLLFINTIVYSIWLKKIIFVDILSISGNFIIRAIAGVILIQVSLSPWLILGVFFIALFLGFLKRKQEANILGEEIKKTRSSFKEYNLEIIKSGIIISTTMVIITYSLYAMNSVTQDWRLVMTVPIIVYLVFRQIYLVDKIGTKTYSDLLIEDRPTIIGLTTYVFITMILIYFIPHDFLFNMQ